MNLILETHFGSHLYGTDTPASDFDWKAIRIPSAKEILLQRIKLTITDNTKVDTTIKNAVGDVDRETWALHQFFKLVGEGQTVAMDVLFSPPVAWVGEPHPLWLKITDNRHRLVSSKSASFLGYCRQQANKYGIKGSRMKAAELAAERLETLLIMKYNGRLGEFDLWLMENLSGVEHIEFVDIPTPNGGVVRHLSVCGRKAPYTSSLKTASEIFTKLYTQYGVRARAAKANEGVDWKALSHAVRVGTQAVELLTSGHVTFPRPEAAHLVAIKTGQLTYEEVANEIEDLLTMVEEAALSSTLPSEPDHQFMEDLTLEAYHDIVVSLRLARP